MSGALPPVGATSGSSAAVASPPPPPPPPQQEITAAQLSDAIIREIIRQRQQQQQLQQQQITAAAHSVRDEIRGWLMLVATLTASITYSAAINPPGGVWQADDAAQGYIAGRPVLDKFPTQYFVFRYFNFLSFMISICIIMLSSVSFLYTKVQIMSHLGYLVGLDIAFLTLAFVCGSGTVRMLLLLDLWIAALVLCITVFIMRLLRTRARVV